MTGPLTYPPEIVIESSIELPPEFDVPRGISFEAQVELTILVIEPVVGLFEGLLSYAGCLISIDVHTNYRVPTTGSHLHFGTFGPVALARRLSLGPAEPCRNSLLN